MSDDLIFRFLNGKLNKDEIREFEQWISSSSENFKIFDEYRKIWLGTAAGISSSKYDPAPALEKVQSGIHKLDGNSQQIDLFRSLGRFKSAFRIAAMVVLLISSGAVLSWIVFSKQQISRDKSFCEVIAPPGSKSQITFPDGSKAWINAGSKLSYTGDFNKADRIVNLEGEGYFTVTSNKAKPFIVQTAHLQVKAFGTVFNVKAYPEELTVETTLVEGVVEIEASGKTKSDKSYTFTLRPKQNIIYHIESGVAEQKSDSMAAREKAPVINYPVIEKKVQVISNIKPELYTSWKDENWVIEGMPLDQLAVLMERRFNSRIEIRDDALKLYKFTGTIQNETLEQMLVILSMTTPLEYSIGKGNVSWILNKKLEKNYTRILKR
jgi:transmembrane sensor